VFDGISITATVSPVGTLTEAKVDLGGKVLPLAPSQSRLPWAVENLRFCSWCDQLAQRDLNDCPHCGRRMAPVG